MTTTASDPSAKRRSVHVCAMLLLLLTPLAVGALWVAKRGSHGAAESCLFDEKGEWATFKWYHYSTIYAELRLRTFELDRGRQISQERRLIRIARADESWAIQDLGSGKFKLLQFNEDPSRSQELITFSIPAQNSDSTSPQTVIDGLVLATEFKANATRIVLIDPKTSRIVDEAEVAGRVDLYRLRDTNYLTLSNPDQAANPISRRVKVEGGKITIEVSPNAPSGFSPIDEFGKSYLFSVSSDGKSMEVRSIENNELRSSVELPNSLLNPLKINYYSGPSWVSLNSATAYPALSIDIPTGKELPVPQGWTLRERNRNSKRMLALSREQTRAKLIDEESGAIIADIVGSARIVDCKFIADGKELLIANVDQQITRLDARTGKVMKIIAPNWFVSYLKFLSAVAFFCWACAWIRCSSAIHRHAWIDCAIISGLCVGYIILETRMTGFPGDVIRPIYQIAEGIFASWLILTTLWLVLGRTRLSLRILPQIGIVGLIILIALICVGFQNPRVWELVIATILLCIWLVVAFVPLRIMGYKFLFIEPTVNHEQPLSLAKTAIPMRDMFLLTTVLAGMFALGRFAPPGLQLTVRLVLDLFVLVFAITFTGLAAARVGLSQKSFASRILTLIIIATFGMSLPFLWTAFIIGLNAFTAPDIPFLFWDLRLHTSTACATVICLYAFRQRGWRLARNVA